jgi:hypothetical protein
MSNVKIEAKTNIYSKKDFINVIDTDFKEFIVNNQNTNESSISNIDDFFSLFEDIFYSIPKEGENKSHRYLLKRIKSYLGEEEAVDVQGLLNEINFLNNQVLDLSVSLENSLNAIK